MSFASILVSKQKKNVHENVNALVLENIIHLLIEKVNIYFNQGRSFV